MMEFIKSALNYMWKFDIAIFLVILLGIALLLFISFIYGKLRKKFHKEDGNKNP